MTGTSGFGPVSPLFITAGLARALAFYTGTLGFEIRYAAGDPVPFFAIVGLGAAQIMLKEIGPGTPPLPNPQRHADAKWDAFIHTADPQAFAKSLPDARNAAATDDGLFGVTVADADGYVLFFGRPA